LQRLPINLPSIRWPKPLSQAHARAEFRWWLHKGSIPYRVMALKRRLTGGAFISATPN
jgi:hypothetical protein